MRLVSRILSVAALGLCTTFRLAAPAKAQQVVSLNGAVQFNDDHAFN